MNKYEKKYTSSLFLDPSHRWLPPRAFISRMLFLQWIAPSRDIPSQGPKSRANPCATPCHICDRKPSQIISRGARYGGSCDMARSHGVPTRDLCDLDFAAGFATTTASAPNLRLPTSVVLL